MSYPIEIILNRQLADCLAIPVFITDTIGNLLFYNESAEDILGKRYEDTGEMPVEEWSTIFKSRDENGRLLDAEELPLVIALLHQRPAFKTFWIENLQGKTEKIAVTAYPIIGRTNQFVGAVAIFWRVHDE
jgi:PAS domain-containing protein